MNNIFLFISETKTEKSVLKNRKKEVEDIDECVFKKAADRFPKLLNNTNFYFLFFFLIEMYEKK
jgi:hypothetical protein